MVALGTGSIILDVFTLGGSSIAKGAIKTWIKAGGRTLAKKIGKALPRGGKSFKKYKQDYWEAIGRKPAWSSWRLKNGKVFNNYNEFHHRFIPQRIQRAYNLPNWLINNSINLQRATTIEHAIKDPFRYKTMPVEIKRAIDAGTLTH